MKLSSIFLSALLTATSITFCASQQAPKPKEGQFCVLFNWHESPPLYSRYIQYESLIIPGTIDALHAEIAAEVEKAQKDCNDVAFILHNGGCRDYWFKYPEKGLSFPEWLRKGLNDYIAYAPGGDRYRSTSSSCSSSTASSSTSALAKTTAGSASSSSSATATPTSSALASQAPAACAASAAAAAAQASTALIAPAKK